MADTHFLPVTGRPSPINQSQLAAAFSPSDCFVQDDELILSGEQDMAMATQASEFYLPRQLHVSSPTISTPAFKLSPSQDLLDFKLCPSKGSDTEHETVLGVAVSGHTQGPRNPIYSWKYFADYRAKVMHKENENEDPTWPLHLEDAFLDALLLIPLMGRKKFSSKGTLYGRNMLITEYLWICHWLTHPPAPGEVVPTGKAREKHKMYRQRKQVSSHIQVLKGFFVSHPLFHFFFPRKNDEVDEDRRRNRPEEVDSDSFKNNRVLISLAEGRLPEEGPNYEYFSQLLAADSEVFLRPRTCWIYVASSEVRLADDGRKAMASDGSCFEADAYCPKGGRLEGRGEFPHLILNNDKDTRRELESNQEGRPSYLLHEYTRGLSQKESTSMKDFLVKWESQFPDVCGRLRAALDEIHTSHEHTSRCVVGPCDTFHLEVVLDLHTTSRFPAGSHLDGVVRLNVCRPELLDHSWRSTTTVVKPPQLDSDDAEAEAFSNFPQDCESRTQGDTRDTIQIPFPATSWARTFMNLAPYVAAQRHTHDGLYGQGDAKSYQGPRHGPKRHSRDHSHGAAQLLRKTCTASDLLHEITMYQEIWSAPSSGAASEGGWVRRAVLVWTFNHAEMPANAKGKKRSSQAGTSWRFLTKLDPSSAYHQQRAYLAGAPSVPTTLHAPSGHAPPTDMSMFELEPATATACDADAAADRATRQLQQAAAAPLGCFDLAGDYPSGPVTPPQLSGSLSSLYSQDYMSDSLFGSDCLDPRVSFASGSSSSVYSGEFSLASEPAEVKPFAAPNMHMPFDMYSNTSHDSSSAVFNSWADSPGLFDGLAWPLSCDGLPQMPDEMSAPVESSDASLVLPFDEFFMAWHAEGLESLDCKGEPDQLEAR